ncbi:MAG: hypothetical protein HETSPECPRED_006131 [Heterodermia speciosa]|uniref:Glucose-6-phosphate 1-epimerase n=1 Tax=Heterodermia speciosa TaxID=116794 RepID=A0A8H3EKQ5_9LECA|nr:MAG: hypothetical protein HETSPECPRED_006131 [Heterodermia speciosa]
MERSKKPAAIPVSPLLPTPQVLMSEDNSRVTANLPTGERVEVLLYGATVISWKSANGKENLFLSSKAHLDGSKPVRGGIPLVFPVFGPPNKNHATGQLPQHGFARNSRWEYLGKTSSESSTLPNSSGDSSVKLDFGLSKSMIDKTNWPYEFALTYSVTLSPKDLETTLVVRNTGTSNYDFQTLFHTYLQIDDISQITVSGLEKASFKDKVQGGDAEAAGEPISIGSEVDRVYNAPSEQAITITENGEARFEITRDMLSDVVVWNPWIEKAKGMADFGPEDGYKSMICVEAGSVSTWNNLEAGDAWEGGQRIKALS